MCADEVTAYEQDGSIPNSLSRQLMTVAQSSSPVKGKQ